MNRQAAGRPGGAAVSFLPVPSGQAGTRRTVSAAVPSGLFLARSLRWWHPRRERSPGCADRRGHELAVTSFGPRSGPEGSTAMTWYISPGFRGIIVSTKSRFRSPSMRQIPSLDGSRKASRRLSGLVWRPAGSSRRACD